MAGDFRLPRDDRLTTGSSATPCSSRAAGTPPASASRPSTCSSTRTRPARWAGSWTSRTSRTSSRAAPQRRLRRPGQDRPGPQVPAVAVRRPSCRTTSGSASRLTANVGLRYEFITVPTEADGKISNLRNVTDRELTVGGAWHNNPSLKNFAPRLGLAWDPFGNGQDVGARGLRPLLRRDPAQVLLLLGQPQPALHHADVNHQPALPERAGQLQSRTRPSARSSRRWTTTCRRPTSCSSTSACSGRCRATGT